jgi:hypothetical protein
MGGPGQAHPLAAPETQPPHSGPAEPGVRRQVAQFYFDGVVVLAPPVVPELVPLSVDFL